MLGFILCLFLLLNEFIVYVYEFCSLLDGETIIIDLFCFYLVIIVRKIMLGFVFYLYMLLELRSFVVCV